MVNINNLCIFEGRIVKEPKVVPMGQGKDAYNVVYFTIAVDKMLSKEQAEAKKNKVAGIYADYMPCSASGSHADTIDKWFCKGKPIKIITHYESYIKKNAAGQDEYRHIFKVDNLTFVLKDTTEKSNGASHSQNNNHNDNDYGADIVPIDDADIPF